MAIEQTEDIGKTLLDNERKVTRTHRNQHLIVLDDQDRHIDSTRRAADHRTRLAAVAKGTHVERDILVLQRLDRLGVNDRRTAIRQLDSVQVAHLLNVARIGEDSRVGIEHAVYIFPHRHTLRIKNISHTRSRIVRALATESRGLARRRRADKSLTNKELRTLARHCLSQRRGRGFEVDTCILVALVGNEATTHIDPAARHTRRIQILGNDRCREQLAIAHNAVVPHFGVVATDLSRCRNLLQLSKQRIYRIQAVGRAHQLLDHLAVVTPECRDVFHRQGTITRLHALEDTLECVGGLTHCRHNDEQLALVLHNGTQITDTVSRRDRRSAKFVDFHL